MFKRSSNVIFVTLMLQKNTVFIKNTFKIRLNIGFRELQKNPDIYEFFPIQWCRFQNFFGSKKIFLQKRRC